MKADRHPSPRQLARPFMFLVVAVVAAVAFAAAGRWSVDPLDWTHPGAWLDRVDPADALVEVARWVGFALAVYVAFVSATALLAEAAALVRLPRLTRLLRGVVRVVAIPALRRRLLDVTAVVTITASALQVAPASAAPSPAVELVVEHDAPDAFPIVVRGEFEGFGAVGAERAEFAVDGRVVVPGDTLWEIVEDHYGYVDGALIDVVAAANPQITDPRLILPGWVLTLPELPDMPAPTVITGESTWTVVAVEKGDTLWEIVERHYGAANADLVWATIEANPSIDNPNLIYPGQLITLPPLVAEAPEQVLEEPTAAPLETTPPTPVEDPVVAPPTPPPVEPVAPTTAAPPTTVAVAPPTTVVSATTAPETPISSESVDEADDAVGPSVATIVGWTGGAGLAATLLGLAATRQRRLPTARRHERPPKRAVELAVAMRETENLPLVEWASLALRHLGSRLRPRPGEPTPIPRLLRLAEDTAEIVWDSPHAPPLAPWTTADGGWSWNLRRGERVEPTDASAPCPALVTIGRRDGADVLLNLESVGALALTGEPDEVAALARSIGTEAAAGAFGDAPTVLVVGDTTLPGNPEFARAVDTTEAVGWLRDRADSAGALLAHRRLTSLFALRARSKPHDAHEPVVVIVDPSAVPPDDLERILGLANGDLGAVVILLGDHPSVSWQLDCSAREVTLHPLGLQLDSVGVAEELDQLLDEYVPEADLLFDGFGEDGFESDEELDSQAVLADHLGVIAVQQRAEPLPATLESAVLVESDSETAEVLDGGRGWDVELKVLGQVTSEGTKDPLSPTELHLAIFLAFNRGGQNRDTIETMVWPNGVASRTVTNAMAGLRRKLGTGLDGEHLFPFGRNSAHLYYLSSRVITDWDRFVDLVRRSETLPSDEALPLLDEALGLVTGPPFRAKFGYSWAFTDGTVTLITETIKAAGRRCADLHTERGEQTEAAASLAAVMNVVGADEVDELV